MTATAAALRVGGETCRSISRCVSSTKVAILRIFAFISIPGVRLAEAVFPFDLRCLQSANSCVHSSPGCHDQHQQNFVRAGSVVDPDFHGVEMTANVGRVDVSYRHVKPRSGSANLFG